MQYDDCRSEPTPEEAAKREADYAAAHTPEAMAKRILEEQSFNKWLDDQRYTGWRPK